MILGGVGSTIRRSRLVGNSWRPLEYSNDLRDEILVRLDSMARKCAKVDTLKQAADSPEENQGVRMLSFLCGPESLQARRGP